MKSKWTLLFWLLIVLLMALLAYAKHGRADSVWVYTDSVKVLEPMDTANVQGWVIDSAVCYIDTGYLAIMLASVDSARAVIEKEYDLKFVKDSIKSANSPIHNTKEER